MTRYMIYDTIRYDVYDICLTANGLTPGGSSTFRGGSLKLRIAERCLRNANVRVHVLAITRLQRKVVNI